MFRPKILDVFFPPEKQYHVDERWGVVPFYQNSPPLHNGFGFGF
jgi:hypothetical protein